MKNKYENYIQSRGEWISSAVFFGVGVWFLLEALVYYDQEIFLAVIFVVLSGLNFLAAFRFQIATFYEKKNNKVK